ncbi:MAG: DUF4286 family protein [Sphingobacteriales bacterium]|nr:MAG: DUF4286 family protein [Sphingobacteriales bacterium]
MIVYNVTLKLDHSIVEDWVNWMKEEHMPELMATGLFTGRRLCRLLEQDELEGATYVAQYFCNSINEYNRYISEHSNTMREKAFARFGNKFIAFRTIMEVEHGD